MERWKDNETADKQKRNKGTLKEGISVEMHAGNVIKVAREKNFRDSLETLAYVRKR